MFRISIFFLSLFSVVFHIQGEVPSSFGEEEEDLCLVHHVNVLTGQLNLAFPDFQIQGPIPLTILRTYSSGGSEFTFNGLPHNLWQMENGWSLCRELFAFRINSQFFVGERNGSLISYSLSHTEGESSFYKPDTKGFKTSGKLGGAYNPSNHMLEYKNYCVTVTLADGGVRNYDYCLGTDDARVIVYSLREETLPSLHKILYKYDEEKRPMFVQLANPKGNKIFSWAAWDSLFTERPSLRSLLPFRLKTSDNNFAEYNEFYREAGNDFFLEVKSNMKPLEKCEYVDGRPGKCLNKFRIAGNLQFYVLYDEVTHKVDSIHAPAGKEGKLVRLAKFKYEKNCTEVRDGKNILRKYHYKKGKLLSIEYFDKKKNLFSTLRLIWHKDSLHAKLFLDNQGNILFGKQFLYDARGNVLKETFLGNLSGRGKKFDSITQFLTEAEKYTKSFSYSPKQNIPLEEKEDNGLSFQYTYKKGTNLITSKLTRFCRQSVLREFFMYDEDNILVGEIVDDGTASRSKDLTDVTERRIKLYVSNDFGLPSQIFEFYLDPIDKKEKLVQKKEIFYNDRRQICEEKFFDSDEIYRYSIYTEYDSCGRVKKKTTPLGRANTFTYDEAGNLLSSTENTLKKKYTYDLVHRPVSIEEVDFQGKKRKTYSAYDKKGQVISQTDCYGNTTTQAYDEFGHCLRSLFPTIKDEREEAYVPEVHYHYDFQGNVIQTQAPKGEVTKTEYTAYRKPFHIVHGDGTEIFHFYDKKGNLLETLYPDHTQIKYKYDIFRRMTSKTTLDSEGKVLGLESWKYNAFHVVSHTDVRGLTTNYFYNGIGQKIREVAQDRIKTFEYDSLGFLEKTIEGDVTHVQKHDVEGRIIEDFFINGTSTENRMVFYYNDQSKKSKVERWTSQGKSVDLFTYDGQGRLTSHLDPLLVKTTFEYNDHYVNDLSQKVLQKTTIDGLGVRTIETYDALHHLVSSEKKNTKNETVSLEKFVYDHAGNRIQWSSHIYEDESPRRTYIIDWKYDTMGRVTEEKIDQKVTTFSYDVRGRLAKKTFPNQISLSYTYDGMDRLCHQSSSDGTIDIEYRYDKGSDPTEVRDTVHSLSIQRKYNLFGQMLSEIGPSGGFQWSYDSFGRRTHFTLPDGSSIAYAYIGSHLTKVQRIQDKIAYEHNYLQFDPNGHVVKEELINGIIQESKRDILERPFSQVSSALSQSTEYGPTSLVSHKHNSLFGDVHYGYDANRQLVKEGEDNYHFDSLGNPLNAEVDGYNQIVSKGSDEFNYDANGNLLSKKTKDGMLFYSYDAWNRLLSITQALRKVEFVYDPFSRLSSKSIYSLDSGSWVLQDRYFYLYDQEMEIGTISENQKIRDMKVLGLGIKGDIGAAISLEIEGQVYTPLHDFQGNIIAILSSTQEIVDSYSINAFGGEHSSRRLSPWRFSSKRSEENLFFFGKRFYDPSLGRFVTPDPSGYADGANLYVYALNSPLNRLDVFGLDSEDVRIEVPAPITMDYNQINQLTCCKGFIDGVRVDFVVSCNYFHQLQFKPEELRDGKANILDHFQELIPKSGGVIALITAENGINTNLGEFCSNCKSIMDKVPEGTFFIGIHNRSEGICRDFFRCIKETMAVDTPIVSQTRQVMVSIAQHVEKINPSALWLHVAHSEGGMITRRAIEGMTQDEQRLIQKHVYFFAIAPALPTPTDYAFKVKNIFSEKDNVTGNFRFMGGVNSTPECDIKYIPCITKKIHPFTGDHSFLGETYQEALDKKIYELRRGVGLYDGKTR